MLNKLSGGSIFAAAEYADAVRLSGNALSEDVALHGL